MCPPIYGMALSKAFLARLQLLQCALSHYRDGLSRLIAHMSFMTVSFIRLLARRTSTCNSRRRGYIAPVIITVWLCYAGTHGVGVPEATRRCPGGLGLTLDLDMASSDASLPRLRLLAFHTLVFLLCQVRQQQAVILFQCLPWLRKLIRLPVVRSSGRRGKWGPQ